jgi:NADPH:quinone reductase-like Zn-dependent oxidoreductase
LRKILSGLELRSKIFASGQLEITLEECNVASPKAGELLVRMEAAPVNPADLLVMFGPVDPASMQFLGTDDRPFVRASVPNSRLAGLSGRIDRSLKIGNEGAGVVVDAGPGVENLIGRTVALREGTFSEYRTIEASKCLILPEGVEARSAASASINPMTVLAMVDTLRREGHPALVHTAAASNVGQMLNRLCLLDGIPLVNIVRSDVQVRLLEGAGAKYVVNSSSADFREQLLTAIEKTDATLAFDAIGGGTIASDILSCMEIAQSKKVREFSRYGSPIHKQVYIYGLLDPSDRVLRTDIGTAWGVGGWLMTWHLDKIGEIAASELRSRVVAELGTTFKTHYTAELSLSDMLKSEAIERYRKQATGEKYLIVPNRV